ncbi:MAG TPA: tetraacyldisaccharide 4'-kinase [Fibrobacteria bacterium]|nr:tetraacyldisaccharide 4'-kinase [Fibrobacteria bacterium]
MSTTGIHRAWRKRRASNTPPPLLVVGSLRAGGSLKTDLVSWIAERYPGLAVLVHPTGDEDSMLQARFPGRVFRHRDWMEAWKAAERAGFAAGVCDGGLQDPALDGCPALRLVHPEGPRDARDLLPFGPYRALKPLSRSRERALTVGADVSGRLDPRDLPPPGTRVHVACAVARPEIFFRELEEAGLRLEERVALSDHARFPGKLIRRMEAGPIPWLVTEKDSFRQKLPPRTRAVRRCPVLSPNAVEAIGVMVSPLLR